MGLQDEIQQSKFKSPLQKALINIMYSSNWLGRYMKPVFSPYKITEQQFNVLRILRGRNPEPCSAGEIKAVMLDKTPDLTRIIDRLLQKGLVNRKVCETNRRKLDISITREGLDLLSKIDPVMEDAFNELNRITEAEAEELSRILDKLRGSEEKEQEN